VGNQSKINSSNPEANTYGAPISHFAEGQNRNEFYDGQSTP
jgi:hypothetical protein